MKEIGVRPIIEGGLTIVCEMDPRRAARRRARRAARAGATRSALRLDSRAGAQRAAAGGDALRRSAQRRHSRARRRQRLRRLAVRSHLGHASPARLRVQDVRVSRRDRIEESDDRASLLLDAPVSDRRQRQRNVAAAQLRRAISRTRHVREAFEQSLNVPTVRLSRGDRRGAAWSTRAEKFGFDERVRAHSGAAARRDRGLDARADRGVHAVPEPRHARRAVPVCAKCATAAARRCTSTSSKQKRVADADATYVMHTLLRGVVQRGTASRLKRYGLGYVAGKTGTTNDYRDAWFVGYTPGHGHHASGSASITARRCGSRPARRPSRSGART